MHTLVSNIQGYSIHDGPGIRTIVFFKGCRLACRWCSNPECISQRPEVGILKTLCTKCGRCAGVCPDGALIVESGELPRIDRQRCTGCGKCIPACIYKALIPYGKEMSVQEVFDAIRRDSMFYSASGGGVTVSGGEPLLNPQFVRALFDLCRTAGIHTCLETSGYADEPALKQVLPSTNYVLYDLKHMSSEKHQQYTGQPNNLILANARLVAESGVEVLFRMPLIPGINDSSQNIQETAAFLKGLGDNTQRIQLMPYHRLGESKYQALGREYLMHGLPPPETAYVESIKQAFEKFKIQCTISK